MFFLAVLCGLSVIFASDKEVRFDISIDSNPIESAELGCKDEYDNCFYLAVRAIELYKSRTFNSPLTGWSYNSLCECQFPPSPQKQEILQYLHIPKAGTSINWFLHSYFDECPVNVTHPCPSFLTNEEDQSRGLCNGRLFSCAGHRVVPELPEMTIAGSTNLLTMLREPWQRLQSNYYYLQRHPESKLLEPDINTTDLLATVHNVYEFTAYPGIANCATKMLNGYQCGDSSVEITNAHLETAKHVLSASLFFGVSEYFQTSVCLFSWMYGGTIQPHHFSVFRRGDYRASLAEEVLSPTQLQSFRYRERFDIELYDFAKSMFFHRLSLTGCPSID